jgi:hypothetical protein
VTEFDHGDGCSVSGGYVYRGSAIGALRGTYLYSDYCSGFVRSFRFANGRAENERRFPHEALHGVVRAVFERCGMAEADAEVEGDETEEKAGSKKE